MVDTVFEIIQRIPREGVTILLVEQNALRALEIADRAYVVETGRILLSGTGAALRRNPDVQKAYLGGWLPRRQLPRSIRSGSWAAASAQRTVGRGCASRWDA